MAATANRFVPRSSPRRKKFSIIPIISILCVLAFSSVNIYLVAKIIVLENHGQSIVANERLQSKSLNFSTKIIDRPLISKETQSRPLPMKIDHNNVSIGSSWTSPHLVNCHEVVKDKMKQEETGMFMPIHPNSGTFFVMNIHNPMKDDVSYKIYKEGCFECSHLAKLLKALSEYPTSYLLDVGGNIGMWSLVAAASNHQTYTIEPFIENYERVCKSIEKNSFYDRVHVINVAATSETTTFRIDTAKHNFGGGRVAVLEDMEDIEEEYVVKGVPIDSLGLPTDRPVLLKLDVEGHELQALTGALGFLQSANIVYAMTELRPTFQSDDHAFAMWKEIFGILTSKGLQPYRIDYENETKLNVDQLHEWRHVKHPLVRYFDVVWRKNR